MKIFLPLIFFFSTACSAQTAIIKSFDDCIAAGNPVLKSFPAQCITPDGKHFTEHRQFVGGSFKKGLCVDKCGDGVCQEIVCMAEGCPCAETPTSCPRDCH